MATNGRHAAARRDATNGDVGSNRLNVLAQTTPARIRWTISRIREPLSVHTPADSP